MEQTTPNQHNTSKGFLSPLFKLIKIILLIFLGGVIGYLYGEYGTTPKYQNSSTETKLIPTISSSAIPYNGLTTWSKPISYKKGYPIIANVKNREYTNLLSIYSFDDQKLHEVSYTLGQGGALGLGGTGPVVSPDLLYTIFISKDSGKLILLSNDTLTTKEVPHSLNTTYISGWSPDSKKFVFYVAPDTITKRTETYGGQPLTIANFNPSLDSGFFAFNIDSGKITKLYPVDNFVSFIDNDRILVNIGNDMLVSFNINDFEADYGLVKEKFGFGAGQFKFSPDGSKWTYLLSRNPTNDANIIYAQFPNKEGETIDSGGWSDVQWPIFSPNADKIAYQKRDGFIREGVPRIFTWVYDVKTKNKSKFIEGQPVQWADENTLIIRLQQNNVDDNFYYLLQLNTGESKKIN